MQSSGIDIQSHPSICAKTLPVLGSGLFGSAIGLPLLVGLTKSVLLMS
jgi:hypothetical protein